MIRNTIFGSLLALSILVAIGLAPSSTVQAQWPNDRRWEPNDRRWEQDQRRRQREWEREQRRWQTQRNDDWRYGRSDDWRYGSSFDLRQTALNAGYNEGIKEGRKDRQRGDRFEYRDEEDYRNANTDYSSRLGNRELYKQYFRQGFANGYDAGYRGY